MRKESSHAGLNAEVGRGSHGQLRLDRLSSAQLRSYPHLKDLGASWVRLSQYESLNQLGSPELFGHRPQGRFAGRMIDRWAVTGRRPVERANAHEVHAVIRAWSLRIVWRLAGLLSIDTDFKY